MNSVFSIRSKTVYQQSVIEEIGTQVLGPVIHRWMLALHQYITLLDDGNTEFLFCARAGTRLLTLYSEYLADYGAFTNGKVFWISRLAACKGTFRRAPLAAAEILANEYSQRTIAELLKGLLRHQPRLIKRVDWTDAELRASGEKFVEWIAKRSPNARFLLDYFVECNVAMTDYLEEAANGHKRLVLVDTGWQGTSQWLLSNAFPEFTWKGLYFGRCRSVIRNEDFTDNVIGTMFEADIFDAATPVSAVIDFRHLLEMLLESDGPSIEEIPGGKLKKAARALIEQNEAASEKETSDVLFSSVLRYIRAQNASPQSLLANFQNFQAAEIELERLVHRPTRREALALGARERSLDFGRPGALPLLRDAQAFSGESQIERIERALWPSGQIALEYDEEQALVRQQLWLSSRCTNSLPHRPVLDDQAASTHVAIVTRTKSRPVLLRRAAESVASQTFSNYTWVVVNDGGDVSQVEAVISSCRVDPRKILLLNRQTSGGMEAASNLGIANSRSEFIVIHDDDDSWDPDFLEGCVDFLCSDQGRPYGGVIAKAVYVSEEIVKGEVVEHGRAPYQSWVRNVQFSEMAHGNFFPPIAFLFRRSIYEKVGGFNEELPVLGDWFFNLEFLLFADIGVIRTTTAFYHHRDSGSSSSDYSNSVIGAAAKHEEYAAIARNRFFRKHASANPAAAAIVIGSTENHGSDGRSARSEKLRRTAVEWENSDDLNYGALEEEYDRLWIIDQLNREYLNQADNVAVYRDLQIKADTPAADLLQVVISRNIRIHPPRNFDEQAYLARNADVADACQQGAFVNGYVHYLAYGKKEGRRRFRKPH